MAVLFKTKSVGKVAIYKFGPQTDGDASMKAVLGGKGANLAEMAQIGIPVPPGFTIPCDVSVSYTTAKTTTNKIALVSQLGDALVRGTKYLESCFGYMPLVSVRSGARVSMPGMMDTILNVGLCDDTLPYWKEKLGDRAALDSYRRLIQMYSSVALGVPMEEFENYLHSMRQDLGLKSDSEFSSEHLERVVTHYLKVVEKSGKTFPQKPMDQLKGATKAVFESWNNPRAIAYRKIHGYPDDWGTAVNIQSMVFGNLNDQSATGVVFTRCPSTGYGEFTGEFLVNAQGEDVVAGIRTPQPMYPDMDQWDTKVYEELESVLERLEHHYKDMQDVEFTVQDGKLFILQTRSGKRSPKAAFKIAHDLVCEGLISKEEAVGRVTQAQLLSVMQDAIDPAFKVKPHLVGIAAGGGVVSGVAMFSSEDAVNCKEPCILIRKETDPDDIAGMNASVGILTATGGLTSHAAVVARGMNKSCVVGCTALTVESGFAYGEGTPTINKTTKVTIDGATGNVWIDIDVPMVEGGASAEVRTILGWAAGNVSERMMLDSTMSLEEMQKVLESTHSQSIYIDTALFELSSGQDRMEKALTALGVALDSYKGSEIVLDFTGLDDHLSASDMIFDFMFAVQTDLMVMSRKVKKVGEWSEEVKGKTIAKLPKKSGNIHQYLVTHGIKCMGHVEKVSDLLEASGPVQVSEDVIQSVFGSKEAFEKLKAMIEASSGKDLSGSITEPVYWHDFLGKVA